MAGERPPCSTATSTPSLHDLSPDREYPPDALALQAQVTCDGCGSTFSRYTFELVASLGAGDDSVSVRPAIPRVACPECGRPIETEPLEPL